MKGELISVIMPVYNGEAFIEDAISSVLAQEDVDLELLIINDGSTDSTAQIISSFSDPRIKVFERSNAGVSAARNVGLANMSGSYFCTLDADDMLPEGSLRVRSEVLRSHPDIHFVDGLVEERDQQMQRVLRTYRPCAKGAPRSELMSLSGRMFFGPSWMVRVVPGRKYAFRPELTHGEDLQFYVDIADQGAYDWVDQVILHHRSGHHSAMSDLDALHAGYVQLHRNFSSMTSAEEGNVLERFSARVRQVMVRSYLREFRLLKAFKAWIHPLSARDLTQRP